MYTKTSSYRTGAVTSKWTAATTRGGRQFLDDAGDDGDGGHARAAHGEARRWSSRVRLVVAGAHGAGGAVALGLCGSRWACAGCLSLASGARRKFQDRDPVDLRLQPEPPRLAHSEPSSHRSRGPASTLLAIRPQLRGSGQASGDRPLGTPFLRGPPLRLPSLRRA